ncbi:cbb3-type cytochrome oxidase maturation protein [Desulfuromonas soudanensis]|uniref:Cbb3-type cytochrome oxidase maturation protein n=1 Tax=Desulfuromonas soudanensis TaxID=1603606 RepID=A0A0M4DJ61_9BACT|nr:cbb3-type cytochrome oxidase assembly protein CcoS [Desulfuromonas soudanensis]ALC17082.1 cbb3-type cytochrome oxidase maturation protein [Desulfuromonas soudanensis]
MHSSTLILIILSLFLGTGVWLVFIWAVKKGEFDDIEGAKYRMLEDDLPPTRQGEDVDEKSPFP